MQNSRGCTLAMYGSMWGAPRIPRRVQCLSALSLRVQLGGHWHPFLGVGWHVAAPVEVAHGWTSAGFSASVLRLKVSGCDPVQQTLFANAPANSDSHFDRFLLWRLTTESVFSKQNCLLRFRMADRESLSQSRCHFLRIGALRRLHQFSLINVRSRFADRGQTVESTARRRGREQQVYRPWLALPLMRFAWHLMQGTCSLLASVRRSFSYSRTSISLTVSMLLLLFSMLPSMSFIQLRSAGKLCKEKLVDRVEGTEFQNFWNCSEQELRCHLSKRSMRNAAWTALRRAWRPGENPQGKWMHTQCS